MFFKNDYCGVLIYVQLLLVIRMAAPGKKPNYTPRYAVSP
jgi:hypothetical protein